VTDPTSGEPDPLKLIQEIRAAKREMAQAVAALDVGEQWAVSQAREAGIHWDKIARAIGEKPDASRKRRSRLLTSGQGPV
jgi:hypothetical protein